MPNSRMTCSGEIGCFLPLCRVEFGTVPAPLGTCVDDPKYVPRPGNEPPFDDGAPAVL